MSEAVSILKKSHFEHHFYIEDGKSGEILATINASEKDAVIYFVGGVAHGQSRTIFDGDEKDANEDFVSNFQISHPERYEAHFGQN